MRSSTCKLNVT